MRDETVTTTFDVTATAGNLLGQYIPDMTTAGGSYVQPWHGVIPPYPPLSPAQPAVHVTYRISDEDIERIAVAVEKRMVERQKRGKQQSHVE